MKEKSLALLKIIAQSTQDIATGDHESADDVITRLREKVQAARDANSQARYGGGRYAHATAVKE